VTTGTRDGETKRFTVFNRLDLHPWKHAFAG
jgi:hypothetical protein